MSFEAARAYRLAEEATRNLRALQEVVSALVESLRLINARLEKLEGER
jgi:hypothetical protein